MKKDFTKNIVYAVMRQQAGDPIKDFLSDAEIAKALSMLADILVCTGVQIVEDEE